MQQCRSCRRQDAQRPQNDQSPIKPHHKAIIAIDSFQQAICNHLQKNEFEEIVRGDGDVCNLPGDSSAIADGNAHIRCRKGRGIIDAVANHNHGMACRLFLLNKAGFVLRQHLGIIGIHANLPAIAAAVRSLSPVIMTVLEIPNFRRLFKTAESLLPEAGLPHR